MATEPRDPEAEAGDLRAELGRLDEDLRRVRGFGIETEKVSPLDKFRTTSWQPPPEDSPRQRDELDRIEARRRTIQARLDELANRAPPKPARKPKRVKKDSATSAVSASVDAAAVAGEGSVGSGPAAQHPVLAVEGRFAQVKALAGATLGEDGRAFSNSAARALRRACLTPAREAENGAPVVGPASFLRAALAEGAVKLSPEKPSYTMSEAIAAHLIGALSGGEAMRERLMALVPDRSADEVAGASAADPDLTRALADAARLVAVITPAQRRIDIRHALLAVLKTAQAQRVFFDLGVTGADPEAFFSSLQRAMAVHLQDRIAAQLPSDPKRDSVEAWAEAFKSLKYDPAAAPPAPARQSELHFVADAPARTLAEDRLGVADEARALAEVICLREPGPPLAIGLFGDWGSGKSTFMNMMEAAVGELTGRVKEDADARRRFVTKVVSLKFNAWHYNDANLWASLTSEFFSQLRLGGHGAAAGADYKALVQEVAKRVAKLEGEAASEAAVAVTARKEADSARIELEGLLAKRGTLAAQALAGTVRTMLSQVSKSELARVRDAMDGLGHPLDLPPDKRDDGEALRTALDARSQEIQTEIMRAAELPGRFMAFGRALARALAFRDFPAAALLYGGLLLAALVVIGFEKFTLTGLQATMANLLASGGTVLAVVLALRRIYRLVEPIFRAADDFATRLRTGREALEREIAEKQDKLADAQKKLAGAEAARAQKEAEAARFRGGKPEQVLDYFLNVSDETRRFEGELGTVSRVRRAFEQLNAIVEQRREASEVERIVLYIDDLDRCQVHQVVKVLEAVHLLLAFPLFVVVVGVDARWLQNSLLKFYEKQLRAFGDDAAGPTTADRATVQDYLEKIFQIPVRLRRIEGAAGGGFRRYLDSVAGPVEAAATSAGDGGGQTADGATETGGTGDTRLTPIEVTLKPAAETAQQTLQRITLRKDELDMIETLSPFLGKSPRAVKRFMNIYRLIRGLHRGADLDAFLEGGKGKKPHYPAVQFWLAVEIGMRPEDAALLTELLVQLEAAGFPVGEGVASIYRISAREGLMSDRRFSTAGKNALKALLDSISPVDLARFEPALRAVDEALPEKGDLAQLLAARADTQRFTLRHA